MQKTYNGNFMALPEREEDLFARINEHTAARRKMAEAERRERYLYVEEPVREPLSRRDLRKIGGILVRVLMAAVFAGAAARGWCGPEFGAAGAFACILWAVGRWRR